MTIRGIRRPRVRVVIEWRDGAAMWGTVGVSENIIEASWQALVDAVEYKLFMDEEIARWAPVVKASGFKVE